MLVKESVGICRRYHRNHAKVTFLLDAFLQPSLEVCDHCCPPDDREVAYVHFKQSRKLQKMELSCSQILCNGDESFITALQEEAKRNRGGSSMKRKAVNGMKQACVQTWCLLSHVDRRASRGKFEQVHEGEGALQITCR